MFEKAAVTVETVKRSSAGPVSVEGANNVFRVLHGFYGNLFLSKYASGKANQAGEDEGVVSARQIWAHGLREFDAVIVKSALGQCMERHPEFPPSLPQFVALCRANQPRGPVAQRNADGTLMIGMAPQLRSRYAAQARAINEKHAKKKAERKEGYVELPPGLDGLKQAIANAVYLAGGDEVATLSRLGRELAPRRTAQ